ncbi:MAG: DUF6364 family protein [Chitinophagaceae bacterium]
MKAKLNLSIDEDVVNKAKNYAEANNTTVSEMVQEYLTTRTSRLTTEPLYIKMLSRLNAKNIPIPSSNRAMYDEVYDAEAKKYGF